MPTMSMNKVIHAAVRRDLDRFVAALAAFPDGDAERAAGLGRAWANFDALLAVLCNKDGVAVALQHGLCCLPNDLFVVDD